MRLFAKPKRPILPPNLLTEMCESVIDRIYSGLDLLLLPVVHPIKVLRVFWFHAFKGFHPSMPSIFNSSIRVKNIKRF